MARYLYSELASLVQARRNCAQATPRNDEWFDKHEDRITELVKQYMPSGSGFDSGTKIDLDSCHADKLVFTTNYHHMDENGTYDGWTEHIVTVTPSLHCGFNLRISGRNRNDIKDYIAEQFDYALRSDTERYPDPFAGVQDWTRCNGCYGSANVTASDGKRYCDGCAKHAEDRVLKIGSLVKMPKWEDYSSRGLSMWGWLRVSAIAENSVTVHHAPHPMDATFDDPCQTVIPKSVIDRFHTTVL